jgi:hypothetical protein
MCKYALPFSSHAKCVTYLCYLLEAEFTMHLYLHHTKWFCPSTLMCGVIGDSLTRLLDYRCTISGIDARSND